MDIRHLEYFLQVVKDKSITKAARNLFLTQPALSKTIKNLEEDLGLTLFVKTPRGIEPTDCGIQLANSAAPLVNAFGHIQEQLHDLSELKTGQVDIGVGPLFGFAYICEIMAKFRELYPNIEVVPHVLSSKKMATMLHNYELDIAISHISNLQPKQEGTYDRVKYVLVDEEEMAVICNKNHQLCKNSTANIVDLRDEPLNICSHDYAVHDIVGQFCYNAGFNPKINFVCNSMELLVDMTVSSNSVCILPRPYLERLAICFPDSKILPFDPVLPLSIYLMMREGSYNSYSSLALGSFIEKYFHASHHM